MDSRPVNMLSTGCSTEPTVVNRRERTARSLSHRAHTRSRYSLASNLHRSYHSHIARKRRGKNPPTLAESRVDCLKIFSDFANNVSAEDLVSEPSAIQEPNLANTSEFYTSEKKNKRR
ncbi:hypothetical protein GQ600_24045 [Phytophthora cactorum]|nr:hypothetical protein GQ600_24045 [Phytophthora cactorum]